MKLIASITITMAKITVQNTDISVVKYNEEDYISLTDMAKSQLQEHIIFRWLSLKSTIEYLGEWEMLYNPDFNCTEFGTIKNAAGSNNFVLSVKTWIERTNAIGIRSKAGRYGGTYAHRDIAYHFGMWISPKFQLLLVKEYQRLKAEEHQQLGWSAKRELSKINYRIHTDAIKQNLIPQEVTPVQANIIYANEADVLNVAMFGMTAKQWREANPELTGNIRDYATINELICLSNMENLNAVFIEQGMPESKRLVRLNQIAINQMSIIHTERFISAAELSELFFSAPKWITLLMKFRNVVMRPFGLKKERKVSDLVLIESENMATVCKNDKHLDLEIVFMTESMERDNQRISVSTKVRFHNNLGKCYFAIIKPFHILICTTLLQRAKNNIEKSLYR